MADEPTDPKRLKRFTKLEVDDPDGDEATKRKGKKLKRFAQLDIDGVPKPPRPKPERAPNQVASRVSPPQTPARRPRTAPPAASRRPPRQAPPPPPPPSGPYVRERLADLIPPGAMPGMVTVEVTRDGWTLRGERDPRQRRAAQQPRFGGPRARMSDEPPPVIELTEEAAHEIRQMSREAGLAGCGLRIMAASGPGESYDFALEERPEPEDDIVVSRGIPIFVRPRVLDRLRGRRVTFGDLPGSVGFRFE